MDRITHEMSLIKWASIIDECRNSGMTVRSWCLNKNINASQFYYWERRVSGKQFDTLKRTESQSKSNFVQLQVLADSLISTSSFKTDMRIHIGNSILEISNSVSEELLSNVLKVMSDVK
jgi:hypothetical protein